MITRLKKKDYSAYSEAILATFFSQMGFEVRIEPVIETGRRNDIAVKVNSELINIEIKTPQKSELQEEMEHILGELYGLVDKLQVSRDVYIFLTKEPNIEEQKEIVKNTLEIASREQQPIIDSVNGSAFIRTEDLSFKPTLIGQRMIGKLNLKLPFPKPLTNTYKEFPMLFMTSSKFDTSENGININFTIYVPLEEHRIFAMIKKKRKQLSQESMNMIAFDTSHIPIRIDSKQHYKWKRRLTTLLKKKISRRVGAILFFSRLAYREKISLESSLFVHPNPYKPLPSKFLKKCDLNSYQFSLK